MAQVDHLTDAELVTRTQEGDEEAFRVLCERFTPELIAYVRRSLSPAILRKIAPGDVLQDAFLAAFQHIDGFEDRGPGSFRSWLRRVVDNRVRDTARKYAGTAKRKGEVTRGMRRDTDNFAGDGTTPSQHVMADELRKRVQDAMARLPADYREVLILRQERHFTLEQTAEQMARSKDAVKKLYARAVARLQQELGLT